MTMRVLKQVDIIWTNKEIPERQKYTKLKKNVDRTWFPTGRKVQQAKLFLNIRLENISCHSFLLEEDSWKTLTKTWDFYSGSVPVDF